MYLYLCVSVVSLVSQLRGTSLSMQFSPLAFFISCLHGACSGSETPRRWLTLSCAHLLTYPAYIARKGGKKPRHALVFSFVHLGSLYTLFCVKHKIEIVLLL